jgi:hypothetical protein
MIRRLLNYFKRPPREGSEVHHHYHVVRTIVNKPAESSARGSSLQEAREAQRQLAREEAAERAKRREGGKS